MSTVTTEPAQARRIELILRQIDSLPTLPAIATKLLTLTASDDTNAREVIELVSSDQTLTAKVLSMCRRADRGVRDNTMTIDKAVVLLGFNAIRNAALSIKVFELFDNPDTGSQNVASGKFGDDGVIHANYKFDRENFWRHSLAVGIAAELIAAAHPNLSDLPAAEAFVCGLMHDVGKIALDYVLPKSYSRVIELAELNQSNISVFERKVMGIDHHTAGKRLSEQWLLPYWIQDCIWLHGSDYETLPQLGHRRIIGLVTLADLLVRLNHIGYSGNFVFRHDIDNMALELGLIPKVVHKITRQLHEELQQRSEVLGLNDQPSRELFLQSIQQANVALGQLNSALERRTNTAARQSRVLETVSTFHKQATPGRTVQDVLDAVVKSVSSVLGTGYCAMLYQPGDITAGDDMVWLVSQYNDQGGLIRTEFVEPPSYSPDLANLSGDQTLSMSLMSVLPWIADHLIESEDPRKLHLLPLNGGWGTVAVMVHDRVSLPPPNQMEALTFSWGSAIAAAAQHEGVRRLGEDLAQANRALADVNRALAETQEKLTQTQSLARLGEMAGGAAHEMNNPLAVISGRAQLLTRTLSPGSKEQVASQTIVDQSHRLSDFISAMRMFASPPVAKRRSTDLAVMLDAVVKNVKSSLRAPESRTPISLQFKTGLSPVVIDPDQIGQAVTELIINAIQASPKTAVHVTAQIDPLKSNLIVQVTDDGKGMDEYTHSHALDPFFSAKPAGRQMGMGLTRVQHFAAAHNGKIDLRSSPKTGTVATLTIPLDSAG